GHGPLSAHDGRAGRGGDEAAARGRQVEAAAHLRPQGGAHQEARRAQRPRGPVGRGPGRLARRVEPRREAPRHASAKGPPPPAQRVRTCQEGASGACGDANEDRGTQEGREGRQAAQGPRQVAERVRPVLNTPSAVTVRDCHASRDRLRALLLLLAGELRINRYCYA
uniref:Uncharacterized protein n=1 Tax=Globisporangium ultimum (strain ATCC 200006 / CBS 805.95 / DAOM BR144) TaxID=431595 RepID=K3WSX5_GLOUD